MVKIMKRIISIIVFMAVLAACSLSEVNQSQRPGGIWQNPSYKNDSTTTLKNRLYVTGLDYPDGYDWRADPENGTVKCSLVVFADGRPVMKIPVGEEYHVSPDPDMHRMIGGHIYTDYSDDDETIIKKDGQEIFRYEGREMILGMAVRGDDIYTLGQPRRGNGFAYRKNGQAVIVKSKGYAFPRLQSVEDSLCFAYSEPIETASGEIERYYHVVNGRTMQVGVREDVRKVWDVIMHQDRSCYLATMTGVSSPVVVNGETMKALELSDGIDMLTSRLLTAGKSLGVEAICMRGDTYSSSLWKDASKYRQFANGMTTNGICTWNDGICCVLNSGSRISGGTIFRCGEIFAFPAGYSAMGSNPIAMLDGILHVGLSSLNGGKPMIWKDGTTQELDINGPICTVTVD